MAVTLAAVKELERVKSRVYSFLSVPRVAWVVINKVFWPTDNKFLELRGRGRDEGTKGRKGKRILINVLS